MPNSDRAVRIRISDGEAPIDFSATTGVVLEAQQLAKSATYVSGSSNGGFQAGGTTVSSPSVSVSSRTVNWTTDSIFLKYDGGEISFRVTNNPMPVRAGNRLTVIFASWPRAKTENLFALYNYDTNEAYYMGGIRTPFRMKIFALIWGLPFLFYSIHALFGHHDLLRSIFEGVFSTIIVSTIPWVIYRVVVRRKFKKRLGTIFHKIVGCLRQGKDLKTLEVA